MARKKQGRVITLAVHVSRKRVAKSLYYLSPGKRGQKNLEGHHMVFRREQWGISRHQQSIKGDYRKLTVIEGIT